MHHNTAAGHWLAATDTLVPCPSSPWNTFFCFLSTGFCFHFANESKMQMVGTSFPFASLQLLPNVNVSFGLLVVSLSSCHRKIVATAILAFLMQKYRTTVFIAILSIGFDRDRRDFTFGTMGTSNFLTRPTKNRSDLFSNSSMERILFFCRPRVGQIFYWNSPYRV